jgi:cytidylate kinase
MAVITISRQFGAGGKSIGEKLAEKLGYTLVDEDLIEYVAQKANVSPEWVRTVEKDAGGTLLRYLTGLTPLRQSYIYKTIINRQGFIDGHRYVQLLDDIIKRIASDGNVIIIGRGSQYILQTHPQTIHLMLVAERADRIGLLRRKYDLDHAQASQIIAKQDKIRNNLFRYFGKEDFDDPLLYHLVLNTSRISLDEAVDMVCGLVQAEEQG